MATTITETGMVSDQTEQTAVLIDGGWAVSWLPGRVLTRDQAITAMTIAEAVIVATEEPNSKLWISIEGWAAELGISAPFAIAESSLSPQDRAMLDAHKGSGM